MPHATCVCVCLAALALDGDDRAREAAEAALASPLLDDLVSVYDLAISFKAGDSFSIYYWEAPLLSSTINWTTAGVAYGKEFPKALSHVSVYLRGATEIPEPGTMALLVIGLFGLMMSRKKVS